MKALLLCLCFTFLNFNFIDSSSIAISENSNVTIICALVNSTGVGGDDLVNCTAFPTRTNTTNTQLPFNYQLSVPSVKGLVGGEGFICALTSVSTAYTTEEDVILCWRFDADLINTVRRRIYAGPKINEVDSGNTHICGSTVTGNNLQCWPQRGLIYNSSLVLTSISVGEGFVCGILRSGEVRCTGNDYNSSTVVGNEPRGSYLKVAAGFRHACAILRSNSSLVCWGEGAGGVGGVPQGEFESVALGEGRGCGLRYNKTVTCWGLDGFQLPTALEGVYLRSLVAQRKTFCAVSVSNYSLFCWGSEDLGVPNGMVFEQVYPGPCRTDCLCQPVSGSSHLCRPGAYICETCTILQEQPQPLLPPPPPPALTRQQGSLWNGERIAFLAVGCAGSLSLVILVCFLVFRFCSVASCRIHDSGRLDEADPERPRPVLEKRLSHLVSLGTGGGRQLEEFPLQVLIQITNDFSDEHKIGSGSFGSVYRATLPDGQEVAIKRAEITTSSSAYVGRTQRNQQDDKDNAFMNELEFLSRVHHKNLVRLLGFCEDRNERILVYEWMKNGTLHDHLHKFNSVHLMSWTTRIKVALDAARGIQYLHVYAVPTIIHRDIKSSNILLDENWIAKVSDFGLSLTGPCDDVSHLSLQAAGTMGYMDPEYYRLQQLTTKSDVYSFGVVLLELLSGQRAIHKNENGVPRNVVDYAVPFITQDEVHRILDRNVPPPTPFEIEAVSYVGYLAADCVTLQGVHRPSMTEVVNSLERAVEACTARPQFSRSSTESSA